VLCADGPAKTLAGLSLALGHGAAGYDPMRLACRVADLPVQVLGRPRRDRSCASRRNGSLARAGHPGTGRTSSSLTG